MVGNRLAWGPGLLRCDGVVTLAGDGPKKVGPAIPVSAAMFFPKSLTLLFGASDDGR